MWMRVFSRDEAEITPAELAGVLSSAGFQFTPHFRGDDLGWTSGEFHFADGSPVVLQRYLTKHDKIRDDLNAYAAELEQFESSPHSQPLMEQMIQTQQLVTLRRPKDHPDETSCDRFCLAVIQFIASRSDGVYQIDRSGWFTATGEVLIRDD